MNLMSMRRRRASNKGFNLIEAAIVLGIVGLVVGGIWVAATSVYANLRSKSATDQLLSVAQSVRALYATSSAIDVLSPNDLTPSLARANALPTNVLTDTPNNTNNGNTINPWGGRLGVYPAPSRTGVAQGGFIIGYSQVPSASCTDFIVRNTGTGRDSGMYGVSGAVGGAIAYVAAPTILLPANGPALTVAQATGANVCDSAGAVARNLYYYFDLKG